MPTECTFRPSARPTLGVEVELQLIDADSMALCSAIGEILAALPPDLKDSVKPEFMQCYVEINTAVCERVADIEADLRRKIGVVERIAETCGTRLFWAGTHPFSSWREQRITPDERYQRLARLFQETVVRPVTFGLHMHVGVESGDAAICAIRRLEPFLPLLLALSANSPFWHGRWTGHHAHRVEVLEGIPTGGPPPHLADWDAFTRLAGRLAQAGFIDTHRELWWDARPSSDNGTVEVRICDMPPNLEQVSALTALTQCLVHKLGKMDDEAGVEPEDRAMIIRQNRWRACRFGMDAALVDPMTLEAVPARLAAERLVQALRPTASELGCVRELDAVLGIVGRASGSELQLSEYERTGDLVAMIRHLAARSSVASRASPPPMLSHCALGNAHAGISVA